MSRAARVVAGAVLRLRCRRALRRAWEKQEEVETDRFLAAIRDAA